VAEKEVRYTLTLTDLFTSKVEQANSAAHQLEATIYQVGKIALEAFAVEKVFEFGKAILETTAKFQGFENRIRFASLNTQDATANMNFLTGAVEKLNLPMETLYEGFSDLQAGLMGTKVQGETLRGLFEGISVAGASIHIPEMNLQRALYDLKEIGEVGLQGRMVRSLQMQFTGINDVVRQEFGATLKQLEEKGMSGVEFLSRLGPALKNYFSSGLEAWNNSLQAKMQKTHNEFIQLQLQMGADLEPFYISLMNGIISVTEGFKSMWHWAVDTTKAVKLWAKEHQLGIEMVAGAVVAATAGWIAYTLWTERSAIAAAINTGLTLIETVVLYGLGTAIEFVNAMFLATPIGWIVGGLMLLGAAVVYAWNKFETFRAVVTGIWEWIKELGGMMGTFFHGLGVMILNIWNPKKVMEGAVEMAGAFHEGGKKLGEAYERGFNTGRNNFRLAQLDKNSETFKAPGNVGGDKKKGMGLNPVDTSKPETKNAVGQKNVTVNVHIGNLVKEFTIKTTNITEGAGKIKEMVAQALIDATNDSQLIAGQ
jgi:hypothetical protein